MITSLIIPSIYSILFFLNLFIAEKIRIKLNSHPEISRKVVHILSGLVALTFPYTIHSHWVILFLVSFFGFIMYLGKRKGFLPSIHNVNRKSYGHLYYPLAIYLIFFLASDTPVIYFTSILVMTMSDTVAALLGQKYGTLKYKVGQNYKSLEGSICFLFCTFLCVLLPLLLMSPIGKVEVVLISAIIAIILTGLESISLTGSDNIIIPFITYFMITKMSALPLTIILSDLYILFATAAFLSAFSLFRTTGIISIMLLNYATFALTNIYWVTPLLITEIFLIILALSCRKENSKLTFKTIFHLGIIPTILIFLFNIIKNENLFILFLVSILAHIPLSFNHYLCRRRKLNFLVTQILAQIVVILITIISLYQIEKVFSLFSIISVLSTYALVHVIYLMLYKVFHPDKTIRNNYKLLTMSTALGLIISFGFLFGGVLYV